MNTNLTEMVKKLPDQDDFLSLADEIRDLSIEKSRLELELKRAESLVVKEVTTNPTYFVSGKVPAMSYIDITYRFTGLNNELIEVRERVAQLTAQLENRKIRIDAYKMMLDIWRTLSANERKGSF